MRPDQHKKKKNSEYKKKHGISAEKGEKHNKKGSTGGHRSDRSDASITGHEVDAINVDPARSSDERESKNFSRRKVESNWERYREDFDDESEPNNASRASNSVPIGADFQNLLDKATSAGSHFQFKNEKEWENLNTDEVNQDGPSLLSIDCHALAQSLRNIPLEQRLDIDRKYSIEDECVDRIQTDKKAISCRTNDQETIKKKREKSPPTVSPNNMNQTVSHHEHLTKASDRNEVHTLKSPEKQKSEASTHSEGKKQNQGAQSTKSDAEDDLEFLLGTDNKVNTTTAQTPAKDTKENLEDWLDSILD